MREIKFRGYRDREDGVGWVCGYYVKILDIHFIISVDENGYEGMHQVDPESVGMHWIDGVYEGDIFVVDGLYPFFKDKHNNYVGTIDYVPHRGWAGWYYGMHCINDNLKGSACGGSLADLEDDSIRVIGNTYENPELINE